MGLDPTGSTAAAKGGKYMYDMDLHDPDDVFDQMHEASTSLPGFVYRDEQTLAVTDLGNRGVKLELGRNIDTLGAIILPTTEARACGEFVLKSVDCNKFGLPNRLTEILKKILRMPEASVVLQRGDKARIKEALEMLESQ